MTNPVSLPPVYYMWDTDKQDTICYGENVTLTFFLHVLTVPDRIIIGRNMEYIK